MQSCKGRCPGNRLNHFWFKFFFIMVKMLCACQAFYITSISLSQFSALGKSFPLSSLGMFMHSWKCPEGGKRTTAKIVMMSKIESNLHGQLRWNHQGPRNSRAWFMKPGKSRSFLKRWNHLRSGKLNGKTLKQNSYSIAFIRVLVGWLVKMDPLLMTILYFLMVHSQCKGNSRTKLCAQYAPWLLVPMAKEGKLQQFSSDRPLIPQSWNLTGIRKIPVGAIYQRLEIYWWRK